MTQMNRGKNSIAKKDAAETTTLEPPGFDLPKSSKILMLGNGEMVQIHMQ